MQSKNTRFESVIKRLSAFSSSKRLKNRCFEVFLIEKQLQNVFFELNWQTAQTCFFSILMCTLKKTQKSVFKLHVNFIVKKVVSELFLNLNVI